MIKCNILLQRRSTIAIIIVWLSLSLAMSSAVFPRLSFALKLMLLWFKSFSTCEESTRFFIRKKTIKEQKALTSEIFRTRS